MAKLSELQEKEVCKMYKELRSLTKVGKEFGISAPTVKTIIARNGIEANARGERKPVPRKRKINLIELLGFDEFTYGG